MNCTKSILLQNKNSINVSGISNFKLDKQRRNLEVSIPESGQTFLIQSLQSSAVWFMWLFLNATVANYHTELHTYF